MGQQRQGSRLTKARLNHADYPGDTARGQRWMGEPYKRIEVIDVHRYGADQIDARSCRRDSSPQIFSDVPHRLWETREKMENRSLGAARRRRCRGNGIPSASAVAPRFVYGVAPTVPLTVLHASGPRPRIDPQRSAGAFFKESKLMRPDRKTELKSHTLSGASSSFHMPLQDILYCHMRP